MSKPYYMTSLVYFINIIILQCLCWHHQFQKPTVIYDFDFINIQIFIDKIDIFFSIKQLPKLLNFMTSLREHLNYFIFSSSSSEQIISILKKQLTGRITPDLIEKRSDSAYSNREMQRVNGFRYAQGFKLCKETSNPNLLLKNIDYLVNCQGIQLNTGAFLATIQLLGDQEQVKYWRQQVFSGKAIGAYGQTEVGHGSNVKQLQTTATYDESKQSFILNSPKVTSSKYWPANLGLYGTHSVIQAKTSIKGKNIGIQTFVVQIRDKNLQTLKNVQTFDIGPKLGFNRVDNGGVSFSNIQIPRKSMLMKYIKVNKDGSIEGLQNKSAQKYGYGSMLNLRVQLTYLFAMQLIIFPSISLYELFRKKKVQQKHQNRKMITDNLCLGYGMMIANQNPKNIFNKFLQQIEKKNFEKADKHLINCHIMSSTFKAVSSRIGIDKCTNMLTYDQLGVFKSSMMPQFLFTMIPSATYEGDNTVLLQQTAKFLFFKFDTEKDYSNIVRQFKDNDWVKASQAIELIVSQKLKFLKKRLEEYTEKGLGFQTIWNQKIQVGLVQVSNLWGCMTFLRSIQLILPTIKEHKQFYRKICEGFTACIVNRVYEFQIYDFKVTNVQVWKQFNDEQFKALVQINTPIQRNPDPFDFYERSGNWMQAKL